jgi:hypothetical protein
VLRRPLSIVAVAATFCVPFLAARPVGAVTVAWDAIIPRSDGHVLVGVTQFDGATFVLLQVYDPSDGTDVCRVARLDAAGSVGWNRPIGRGDDIRCVGISAGPDALYVAVNGSGSFDGTSIKHGADAYVLEVTKDGEVVWTRRFATADSETSFDIAAGGGGVYVAGWVISSDPRTFDAWVRRYDADGSVLWTRFLRTDEWDSFSAVAADATGVYLGYTSSADVNDGAIRKYDPAGTLVWETTLHTGDFTDVSALALAGGTLYAGGHTDGVFGGKESAGAGDAWTASLGSATGSVRWVRQFGSNELDYVTAIAAGPMGVYAAGSTYGELPRFESRGLIDAFVRGFDPDGRRRWTRQFGTPRDDFVGGAVANPTGVLVGGTSTGNFGAAHQGRDTAAFVRQWQPA